MSGIGYLAPSQPNTVSTIVKKNKGGLEHRIGTRNRALLDRVWVIPSEGKADPLLGKSLI